MLTCEKSQLIIDMFSFLSFSSEIEQLVSSQLAIYSSFLFKLPVHAFRLFFFLLRILDLFSHMRGIHLLPFRYIADIF